MQKSRQLVQGAVVAAIVCLMTTFLRLPIPLPQGYVHLGDVAIFAGAVLLGRRSGWAAGLGSALADLLAGFALYMPATAIIKGLMGFAAGSVADAERPLWQVALVFFVCGAGMAAGYLVFEWALYGWAAALGAFLPNLAQGWISAALALALLPLVRRVKRAVEV